MLNEFLRQQVEQLIPPRSRDRVKLRLPAQVRQGQTFPQAALDTIWDVEPKPSGWKESLRQRLFAFIMVLIVGVLLLAAYARNALIRINDELALMVEDRMVKVEQLEQIKHNLGTIGQVARNLVLDFIREPQELQS